MYTCAAFAQPFIAQWSQYMSSPKRRFLFITNIILGVKLLIIIMGKSVKLLIIIMGKSSVCTSNTNVFEAFKPHKF